MFVHGGGFVDLKDLKSRHGGFEDIIHSPSVDAHHFRIIALKKDFRTSEIHLGGGSCLRFDVI